MDTLLAWAGIVFAVVLLVVLRATDRRRFGFVAVAGMSAAFAVVVLLAAPHARADTFASPGAVSAPGGTGAVMMIGGPVGAPVAVVPAAETPPGATPLAVHVPWGDTLDYIITQIVDPILGMIVLGIVVTVFAWISPHLPAGVRSLLSMANATLVEQLLTPAISTGLQKADAEAKGKSLDIPLRNTAVAEALNYALAHGSTWLVKWMGGAAGVQEKIEARLPTTLPAPVIEPVAADAKTTG